MAIAGFVEGIVSLSATSVAVALVASGVLFVLVDYARMLRLRSKMVRSSELCPCFCTCLFAGFVPNMRFKNVSWMKMKI